jgi:succinoglycan biosynthesis protein ExoV
MKMYFYRGRRPNFGDELNVWLWPPLLPGFFDDDERELFIGIGSTLFDFLPRESRKIVFGAGYGGYTAVPAIDEHWRFYFVRGRLTAAALGLDPDLGVGDAAILVRSCVARPACKAHRTSFMPHWESAADGQWGEASRAAGLHYIDPCDTVENVLTQIQKSEVLVAEAMHGAIVADALRVPWIPVRPLQPPNRAKWHDWASALGVTLRWAHISPSNALELAMSLTGRRKRYAGRIRARGQGLRAIAPGPFRELAARSLARAASREPSLSSDAAIDRAHTRMLEALDRLKTDFADRLSANGKPGLHFHQTIRSRSAAL